MSFCAILVTVQADTLANGKMKVRTWNKHHHETHVQKTSPSSVRKVNDAEAATLIARRKRTKYARITKTMTIIEIIRVEERA